MDRRVALLVLWVAFVVAAVGVGFGAAGLVGHPFTDGVTDAASDVSPGTSQAPSASRSSSGPSSGSPSSTRSPSASPSSSGPSSTRSPSASPSSTRSPSASPSSTRSPSGSVTRSINTRGGLASATCRSGSVRLSASPAVGWQIEDIDPGPDQEVRVRFESSDDDGGRVEVRATCNGGSPRFELDDDGGEGGGGGGEDGGGEGD